MFTGIITHIGTITSATQTGDLRLEIACALSNLKLGDSVACSGACLTVVELFDGGFAAELSGETIACTAPNMWQAGKKLNIERAAKIGDSLDGHIVTGHVDGVATIHAIEKSGDSHVLAIDAPAALSRFIAQKGSVTLDGISLTVNKVEPARFWVNIIPHTWAHTTLGSKQPGDALNMEIDIIARYVARLAGTA